MASAATIQIARDASGPWNLGAVQVGVGNAAGADEWPCRFVKTLDDPEALAYHADDASGYPTLFVGCDVILNNGGTLLEGSNSLSAALTHEILEALVDEWCDYWSDWRDGTDMVALEVADPVQDGCYDVQVDGSPVSVSNFVLPEWFRAGDSREKYDHLGVLKAPLTISPGGYVALRSGRQVFGEAMPDWLRAAKARGSRRARRRARALP